jgi:hypothetical protein
VLYVCNVQSIGSLCSPLPEGEPSATYYLRGLSAELIGHLEMLAGVIEDSISAAVKGTLVMARSYVDLGSLQTIAIDSGLIFCPWRKMCEGPHA